MNLKEITQRASQQTRTSGLFPFYNTTNIVKIS